MKAIRVRQVGPPSVMQLEEVPDPAPGPGQVLVEIKAAGVNPVDTYIRSGGYARMPALPYTPGGDGAGTVRALGAGAAGVSVGERVYITGTAGDLLTGAYAELAVCNLSQVKRLPANVTFSQGAGVNVPCATAYRALFHKGRAVGGDVVLVHGATGAVGIAAVQLARAAGCTVIGTGGTDRGRTLVRDQGAHHVLDHTRPDYLAAVAALTGGHGADVIVENLANVNLAKDLDAVARHGRIVVVGNRGTIEINPRGAMGKDAVILGLALWNASDGELASIHGALVAGLENGTLRPVIGKELPLREAAQAHEAVMQPGAYGKIVLIP